MYVQSARRERGVHLFLSPAFFVFHHSLLVTPRFIQRTGRSWPWAGSGNTVAAVILTTIILGAAAWPNAPLTLLGASGPVRGFTLLQPMQYLFLAPLTRLLDELSLLAAEQHLLLLETVALAIALRAAFRAVRRNSIRQAQATRALVHDLVIPGAVLVLLYVVGAIVPRPMVALRASDPAEVLVDFHSHTSLSHDGRWGFSAEANRAWHAAAGFNAAYITDHQSPESWRLLAQMTEGAPQPRHVQEGTIAGADYPTLSTTLLPGIETAVPGAHVNLLGVGAAHATLFRNDRNLDTLAFDAVPLRERPVVLLTLPFDLTRSLARVPRVDAIEISDGSPRGLSFARANLSRIRALSDSLKVPLVASSNNHGWGATAVAWTAVRIEGWQALTPQQLEQGIRAALLERPSAVRVVERSAVASGVSSLAQLSIAPRLLLHIVRVVSPAERVAFVAWIWSVWLWRRPGSAARGRRRRVIADNVRMLGNV